jgi:hypothetical protein
MRLIFNARVSIISLEVTTKSWWIFITAKPFNRFSPVVFLKYVFKRRKEEKDLSLLAVVTGKVINIFKSRWTVGNIYYCVILKVQQSTSIDYKVLFRSLKIYLYPMDTFYFVYYVVIFFFNAYKCILWF